MPGTLRWGILGPGGIARQQTTDLLAAGFSVSAVGSRSLESAEKFATEFGIGRAHGSYAALVSDPEVDIAYISTPHPFHFEQARLALNAGKHALVEKPFMMTAEQARTLTDLAESSGLVILEAMWSRYLPHMVRLREILAVGMIGEVRTVIADHNQSLPTDPEHRIRNPRLGGGALLDLGIYPISFVHDMLGQPERITATGSLTAEGVDRQIAAIFDYPGGQQGIVQTALDSAGPNRAVVLGTKGWVRIDPTWYGVTSFTVFGLDGTELETFDETVESRGMQFQAAELERLVEAGLTHGEILSPAESTRIMEAVDEIRRQVGIRYPADILTV